jgi:hypothetical protein
MAIDLEKMRQKLNKLNNKGGSDSNFWKPEDGDSTIRIVPTSDGDPFKEFFFHYIPKTETKNRQSVLSPYKNFGEDDPMNKFVRSLFDSKDEESIKMAKTLMAKPRFFAPVIVRGEESKGVQVWGFGKQVYEQLLQLVLNPEYGDITDVNEGTDLHLTYGKPAGATYPVTRITPARKTSKLCKDISDEECASILESVPDFDTLHERKTPDAVGQILEEFLAAGGEAEESSNETSKYSSTKTSTSAAPVDQAFNELMSS